MSPKPPGPAAVAEESRQLYLPNFCAASTVLVIVVICELTALLLALARNSAALGFWSDLGLTSMFLLWIALCGAGLLCLLRNYLSRQSVAVSAALVLAIILALVTLVSGVAYYFGSSAVSSQMTTITSTVDAAQKLGR